MRHFSKCVQALGMVFVLIATTFTGGIASAQEREEVHQELGRLKDSLQEALNKRDPHAMLPYLHDDIVFTCAPNLFPDRAFTCILV